MNPIEAILYPFKKKNIVNVLIIPLGTILSLVYLGSFIKHQAAFQYNNNPLFIPLQTLYMLIYFLLGLIFCYLVGYCWKAIGKIQEEGVSASAPSWREGKYLLTFICLQFIKLTILQIFLIIGIFSFGLLLPFAITPFVMATREQYKNGYFKVGFQRAKERYFIILAACYIVFAVQMFFYIASNIILMILDYLPYPILSYLLLTILFVVFYILTVFSIHLITQSCMTKEERLVSR